jgi:zinc protease
VIRRSWMLLAALASCCPTPLGVVAVAPEPAPPAAMTPPPAPAAAVDPFAASGLEWSKPPAAAPEPAFAPPVPQTFNVAGARVVLVENHRLPLVSVRVVFHRAGAREDGARAGLASLTAALLEEGAGKFDANALPEEVERLGADLDVGVRTDAATVGIDTLAETLEPSLSLLADVIVRPRLTAKDFERIRGDRLAELALRPDQPGLLAGLAFGQVLFAGHPYASPVDGFAATIKRLTLADLKTFWRGRYRPGDATILVTGDVDRARLEGLLARAFTGWRPGRAPTATAPAAPVARPPVLAFIDRPGAPQSVVIIGRLGTAAGDPRYFPAEVVNTAVGGSFLSRLNGRLREELGYTYSIRSAFSRLRWSGNWGISTSLKTASTVDGIREALAIVDAVRTTDLPAVELQKAVLMLTRSAPQDFETNAGIAASFEELIVDGLPLDWHQGWIPGIRAVTAAEARAVADDAWKDLSIVIVGDWATLKDGVGALGRPIVHLDAEGKPTKR